MDRWLIYGMVFCGAGLMLWNLCCFIRYARFVLGQKSWKRSGWLLHVPIILLILFLLGYLLVGLLGKPDLIIAGILFGGSVFVYIMYRLLNSITQQIIDGEHMEAELAAKEENSRMKTRFLATMSHEMKTPLNVIIGLDAVALKSRDLQPETRDHLEKIDLSARHMLGLVKNILDMNELETGQLTLDNAEFSLKDALDQINAITATLSAAKGLNYELSLPQATDYILRGDEAHLKEVLLSILNNAVKYTDSPGTVRFAAEVHPENGGKMRCRFTVSDTGIGIDPQFLPRMFDAFTQEEDSSLTPYGGSGLSLAIARHIVELMGGTIDVQSQKTVGSVFTVSVPLQLIKEVKLRGAADAQQISIEGRRVLIVEDLPENAEIVADLLELEGVETERAENGLVAVGMMEKAEEGYYDAILMDLRMPVMDGLEATRRIRQLHRKDARTIPIIALTANSFESDVRASLSAGMNAHLPKPADAELLYDTLKEFIHPGAGEHEAERRDPE